METVMALMRSKISSGRDESLSGPVKTHHIKHHAAHEENDDEKRQVLTPGGNLLRHTDKSGLKPQQIGQEPGQGDKEEVQEK